MGTIYLAVSGGLADFRKLLVVKELRQDLSADRRFVEMFLNEAKLAARLNHPNVIQTIEAGQQGERYFLSMEFLDGQPFSALWASAVRSPCFPLAVRLKILCEALTGLHYAHELTEYDGTKLRIVHRDISPQNIFVTYDGQVKVLDFGIANALANDRASTPGLFKGKLGYAAPEQVRGDPVDARTDLFAMGVILWETLAMRRFASGTADRSTVTARLRGDEPRAGQLALKIDPRLAAICDRALQVDKDARFPSAAEFRSALEAYLLDTDQQVDTETIRAMMVQKFQTKRRALHRVIDRHIRGGAEPVSNVYFDLDSDHDKPTTVVDLTQYVRETRDTVISTVEPRVLRAAGKRPRHRVWWTVGAATVGAALAFGLPMARLDQPAGALPQSHGPSGAAPASPVAAPLSEQSATAPAAAATPNPMGSAAALTDDDRRAAMSSAERTPDEPLRAGTGRAPHDPAPLGPVARPEPRRAAGGGPRAPADDVRRAPRPRSTGSAAPPEPPLSTSIATPAAGAAPASEPPASEPPAGVGLGGDLNRLRGRYQARAIDTDM